MADGNLSEKQLSRMHDLMAGHVESGAVPGMVALISKLGAVHVEVLGTLRASGGAPMCRDTIFRMASATKPVTAAAAMVLLEECRLRLDDSVEPWLPELANRRVLKQIDSPLDE